MLLSCASYFGLTTSGLGRTGFGTIGTWVHEGRTRDLLVPPGDRVHLDDAVLRSVHVDETADHRAVRDRGLAVEGPPMSFTVTLAVLRVIVIRGPSSGPLCVPSAASAQRFGSFPACPASALFASASSSAVPDGAARSSRCSTRACRREAEGNARLATAVAACRGEHLALAAAVAAATAAVSTTTTATTVPTTAATPPRPPPCARRAARSAGQRVGAFWSPRLA